MKIVALTGGIGAGKSLAAQYFAELGARVVDADQLARVAIERGSTGFDEVVSRFGEKILVNGDIDRKALAAIVFTDQKSRSDLESIIHPRVRQLFDEVVADLAKDEILIYEIPLLVESNAIEKFDQIITVEADLDLRKERLLKRGMLEIEIQRRITAQASQDQREALATYIINNNSDDDALLRSVENIWEELKRPTK